jgi:hypothetical protein
MKLLHAVIGQELIKLVQINLIICLKVVSSHVVLKDSLFQLKPLLKLPLKHLHKPLLKLLLKPHLNVMVRILIANVISLQ